MYLIVSFQWISKCFITAVDFLKCCNYSHKASRAELLIFFQLLKLKPGTKFVLTTQCLIPCFKWEKAVAPVNFFF